MSAGKHYFIEQTADNQFAVRAQDSDRASSLHATQAEATAEVRRLNPDDLPDVERVRNVSTGGRDQWRSA
jgi:hypothetical protein